MVSNRGNDAEQSFQKVDNSFHYIAECLGITLANTYKQLIEIQFQTYDSLGEQTGINPREFQRLVNGVDQVLMLLKMGGKEVASIYIPYSLKQIIPFTKNSDNQEF